MDKNSKTEPVGVGYKCTFVSKVRRSEPCGGMGGHTDGVFGKPKTKFSRYAKNLGMGINVPLHGLRALSNLVGAWFGPLKGSLAHKTKGVSNACSSK